MASSVNTTLPASLYQTPTGWVTQPNIRGTMDLLWSCLLVVFACAWTVLHVNVPAPTEGYFTIALRKARWAVFCIYTPEAITLIAAVQRQSARWSVKKMHELGVDTWTTTHGFFADMGGFRLVSEDMPTFPVNAKSIYYLVEHEYIDAPSTSREEIWDKSKADGLAKLVATIQGGWMLAQVISRPIQGLEVTPLELTTLSIFFCSVVTCFLWIDKPLDIEVSINLELKCPMSQVLAEAGAIATEQWEDTPMDFVEQPGWKEWKRRANLREFGGLKERPIQRFPNDYVDGPKSFPLSFWTWIVGCCYASIHVVGWNFPFPSTVEVQIWRGCSITLLAIMFGWGFVEVLTVKPGLDFQMTLFGFWRKQARRDTFLRRYILDVPGSLSAALYYVARTTIIVQAFVTLRMVPSSVYADVQWTSFLPHV